MAIERCTLCQETAAEGCIAWDCLPVPHFGKLDSDLVQVATVSLNPAISEFRAGGRWRDPAIRLPILDDYDAANRPGLTPANLRNAKARRDGYFGNHPHPFFRSLEDLMRLIHPAWSYYEGTAVHLDVAACTTRQGWGQLGHHQTAGMLQNCRRHFRRTLSSLPDGVLLLLNGSSTVEAVVGQEGAVADLVQDACQITMTHPQWTAHRGKIVGRRKEFRYLGWSPFIQYAKAPTVLSITRWLRDQQHESWN